MIIKFYPYYIERLVTPDEYQDELGDWHIGETEYADKAECDMKEETEDRITYDDGSVGKSQYKIYVRNDYNVKFGDAIRITLLDGSQRIFKVKAKHRFQLQTRIWV